MCEINFLILEKTFENFLRSSEYLKEKGNEVYLRKMLRVVWEILLPKRWSSLSVSHTWSQTILVLVIYSGHNLSRPSTNVTNLQWMAEINIYAMFQQITKSVAISNSAPLIFLSALPPTFFKPYWLAERPHFGGNSLLFFFWRCMITVPSWLLTRFNLTIF